MKHPLSDTTQVCPICFRTSPPKLKIHEEEGTDRIVVTEKCGFCRNVLSTRESTNEIERIRRDIQTLRIKVEKGEQLLAPVLKQRINTYNRLVRNL
jgi:hypothetical protein